MLLELKNNWTIYFRSDIAVRSVNATMIVWLQNDAGYQRWGPTEERVEQLLESFRPGRERERDKAQLLSPTHSSASSSMTPPGTNSSGSHGPIPSSSLDQSGNNLSNSIYTAGVTMSWLISRKKITDFEKITDFAKMRCPLKVSFSLPQNIVKICSVNITILMF